MVGSPISHSKSPALHRAAAEALALPWTYDAVDVVSGGLAAFVNDLGEEWCGLSVTMPLKREALPLLDSVETTAVLAGAVNTILFDRSSTPGEAQSRRGFNTDVYGVVESLRGAGVTGVRSARILGGGATATAALIGLARLGAERVALAVRAPEKLGHLIALAEQISVVLSIETLGSVESGGAVDVVISTLPNGSDAASSAAEADGSVLLDVSYAPWPSSRAIDWVANGGTVISGLEMLAHQALAQVRIFLSGTPDEELPDEKVVFASMRAAVDLPR